MDKEVIKSITDLGMFVYMRNESDSYLYYTDGVNIGYLQAERFGGFSLTTVHKPCKECGTGFKVDDSISGIDADVLRRAWVKAPTWAHQRDVEAVRKFRDMEEFLTFNKWNGGFVQVVTTDG